MRCGASRTTVHRSGLGEIAGSGMDKSHHAFYLGTKLMLITTVEALCAFSLAHLKELDERLQAVHLLHVQPPAPGPCPIVCDKGFAGAGVHKAAADLGHVLIRPPRADEPDPPVAVFPGWLRQRIEAVIWTLKNSSDWNATPPAPPKGSGHASASASAPSTPPSGTTGSSAHPSNAP